MEDKNLNKFQCVGCKSTNLTYDIEAVPSDDISPRLVIKCHSCSAFQVICGSWNKDELNIKITTGGNSNGRSKIKR